MQSLIILSGCFSCLTEMIIFANVIKFSPAQACPLHNLYNTSISIYNIIHRVHFPESLHSCKNTTNTAELALLYKQDTKPAGSNTRQCWSLALWTSVWQFWKGSPGINLFIIEAG